MCVKSALPVPPAPALAVRLSGVTGFPTTNYIARRTARPRPPLALPSDKCLPPPRRNVQHVLNLLVHLFSRGGVWNGAPRGCRAAPCRAGACSASARRLWEGGVVWIAADLGCMGFVAGPGWRRMRKGGRSPARRGISAPRAYACHRRVLGGMCSMSFLMYAQARAMRLKALTPLGDHAILKWQ